METQKNSETIDAIPSAGVKPRKGQSSDEGNSIFLQWRRA